MDTSGAELVADFSFRRGDAIDRFTVLEPLGMGGMGVVVSAYDCTLDRKVAIKVLRPDRLGASPEEGHTRLLREAQAMARLSHPNVITVHEVGTVGEQVFVAMELVEGENLAAWLARAPRPWREVVQMFVLAGRGLAAAHRAGLVHRDFKPENVLVGEGGKVRVTDFGLAGLSAGSPAAAAAAMLAAPLTRTGSVIGTPAYMSPEQHRGEEASERSDQFSFCVALHEALYGVRPFAGETPAEVLDAITSGRVTAPHTDAPRWLRPLILRGLLARPEGRWPSLEALLEALARDPAASRRRWLLLGGAAAAAVAAALFMARDEPAMCEGAAAQAATVWNRDARQRVRAAFLATGSPIAADVFDRVDRLLAGRLDTWAAAHTEACQATQVRGEQSAAMLDLRMQCLERARRQVGSLVDLWERDPVALDKAIDAASSVGDVNACADTEALAMPVAPPRDPDTARQIDQVRARLDAVEARVRTGQVTEGLSIAREAVGASRPLGYPPILAEALYRNGDLECEAGKVEAGVPLIHAAARAASEAHDDVLYARIVTHLLFRLSQSDARLAEAAAVSPFAEAAVARGGNREELVADLLWAQAGLLTEQGKHEDSLALQRRALPLYEKRLGHEHLDVARLLNAMAGNLRDLGRLDESLQHFRRALAIRERSAGPDHPIVASSLNNLIAVLVQKGDTDEANRQGERALAIRERVYPPGHRYIAQSLHNLGALRIAQGRQDDARVFLERAEKLWVAAVGPDHPDTALTRDNLAALAIERGDIASGRRLLESVIAAQTKAYGADHAKVGHAWGTLGQAFLRDEDWKGADAAFSRALAIRRKQEGDAPNLWDALVGLGAARNGEGRHAEAIALLEEAKAIDRRLRGDESPYRDDILTPLGEAYLGAGRVALAVRTLERALAISEADPSEEPYLPIRRFQLARGLWASGARARALTLAARARDGLVGPGNRKERARVERWLRAHGR